MLAITRSPARAPRLNVYRAHALMLLDRVDEARNLYLQYSDKKADVERSGEGLILADFVTLREEGFQHPLMAKIEKLFGVGA
jgi:hypothetical protein